MRLRGADGRDTGDGRGQRPDPDDRDDGNHADAAPPAGDAAAGKVVFTTNCGGCHTLSDAGTTGTVGPNLDDLKPAADVVMTQVINGGAVMPPFKDSLTPKQIADVSAYVSSVAGT